MRLAVEMAVTKMFSRDIVLLHGAVIAVGNDAWLFTAPSGTGKTTHIRLWLDNIAGSYVVNSYIFTRISIYVNNDIQAGIFDRIMDARWSELCKYPNGDILNRFNGDVGTIAANAINWIPNLIINIYTFIVVITSNGHTFV